MKQKALLDTSVIVAAFCEEHPQHDAAFRVIEAVSAGRLTAAVSAHGLAEIYAVVTRAPDPIRMDPEEAWRMIETNLLAHVEVVGLTASEYRRVVEHAAGNGWAGGRVYDLIHLRAAEKSGCSRVITLNERHFREMAAAGMRERISTP